VKQRKKLSKVLEPDESMRYWDNYI